MHYPTALRSVLVWTVCIPIRAAIAVVALWIVRRAPAWARYVLVGFASWTAIGFWAQALWIRPTVGGFGGPVWWTHARWAHATLWTTAAILLAATSEWWSTLPLFVDVLVAVLVTARYHLRTKPELGTKQPSATKE